MTVGRSSRVGGLIYDTGRFYPLVSMKSHTYAPVLWRIGVIKRLGATRKMNDREGNQTSKDEAVRRGTRRPPCRGRPGPRRRCGPGGGTRRSARAARPAPPPAGLDSRPRSSSSAVRRVVVPETGADLDRVAAAASLRNVRVAACGRRFYFALRNIHPARNLGARRPRRANSRHEQRRGSRLLWDQFFWGLPHYSALSGHLARSRDVPVRGELGC